MNASINTRTAIMILGLFVSVGSISDAWAEESKSKSKSASDSKDLIECLIIEQEDMKIGKVKLYLGNDRARIDSMNGSATIVTCAPKWDVFMYNRDKQFFRTDRTRWHESGLDKLVKSRREIFAKTSPIVFMGKKCVTASRMSIGTKPNVELFYRDKEKNDTIPVKVTYIASSDLGLPKQIYEFIEGLYLTPANASVMLDTKQAAPGEPPKQLLTTTKIERKKVSASLFKEPKNLTQAASMSAVITGKGIEEMMLNFSGAK